MRYPRCLAPCVRSFAPPACRRAAASPRARP